MKRILILTAAALVVLLATSCGDMGGNTLSTGKATRLLQKELTRTGADMLNYSLQLGYFECNNDETRYAYRCLAANELITYNCDVVKKTGTTTRYRNVTYWGYTYREPYYVDTLIDTYFITVELTEKGQKLLADTNFTVEPSDDIKDLNLDKKTKKTKYPESEVAFVEFENQSTQESPSGHKSSLREAARAAEEATRAAEETEELTEEMIAQAEADIDESDFEGIDEGFFGEAEAPEPQASSAYDKAKKKEHIETVVVRLCNLKVVKVRNIIADRSVSPIAEGEAVIEYRDVTPFGRIIGELEEGQRSIKDNIHFVYYEDKGWQLKRSESDLEEELEAYLERLADENDEGGSDDDEEE